MKTNVLANLNAARNVINDSKAQGFLKTESAYLDDITENVFNEKNYRDGSFSDLPSDLQTTLRSVNKSIIDKVKTLVKSPKYDKINDSREAMKNVAIFCTPPKNNSDVGMVRVTDKGNGKYDCMVQITGHFKNGQKNSIEKLLHQFISDVYAEMKSGIQKEYKIRLDNESEDKDFEGWDAYPSNEIAKQVWDLLENVGNKNVKKPKELKESESSDAFDEKHLDTGSWNYPEPTRNNASKEEAMNCKHSWVYGGGSIWCKHCGWFSQPDKRITKTPSGKSGEVLESAHDKVKELKESGEMLLETDSTIMESIFIKFIDAIIVDGVWKFVGYLIPKIDSKINSKFIRNTVSNILGTSVFDLTKYENRATIHIRNVFDKSYPLAAKGLVQDVEDMYRGVATFGTLVKTTENKSKAQLFSNEGLAFIYTDVANVLINRSDYIQFRKNINSISSQVVFSLTDVSQSGIDIEHMEIQIDAILPAKKFLQIGKKIFNESSETLEYNTDMSETQAKKTLQTLSQSLMTDFSKDKKKKVSQYTANIYANIITKNLLPKWTSGFNKLKITLDGDKSLPIFEFISPSMSQDFVSRFINGRETLKSFIHKNSEIRIKMSPNIFRTMKDPNDAYNFFKLAVQYYDTKLEKAGNRLMIEVMRLGHNMRHLVANSKLSGLVTYPLSLLFVFDEVDMNNKDTFSISDDDIQTVNKFVRNIASHYAAPEKEKKKIIEDVKDMVKNLRECCEPGDNMKSLSHLAEAVEMLYFNGYEDMILESSRTFIDEQIDRQYKSESVQTQLMYEKFGMKRLKKIPTDLVAYISVEAESIRDSNDKHMLISYLLGKLEIIDWYIELLSVGSKKYVVPHNKEYLERMKTQLLSLYKKIMDVKITNPNDRPLIDIKFPKGYEG